MGDLLPDIEGNNGLLREAIPVLIVDSETLTPPTVNAMSAFDWAVSQGRAYSVSTSLQTIPSGSRLAYSFENPVNSGVRVHVARRLFSNNRQGNDLPLQRELILSPASIPAATSVTPNKINPNGGASAATFTYGNADIGTPVFSAIMPLNGRAEDISIPRILNPGDSFGYQIEGSGGGALDETARVSMSLVYFEEAL